jgi:hypothetical protein
MRLSGMAVLALCALGSATEARADVEYPWCLTPSRFTVGTCYYTTFDQCMAAASGNVGSCSRNPRHVAATTVRPARGRN